MVYNAPKLTQENEADYLALVIAYYMPLERGLPGPRAGMWRVYHQDQLEEGMEIGFREAAWRGEINLVIAVPFSEFVANSVEICNGLKEQINEEWHLRNDEEYSEGGRDAEYGLDHLYADEREGLDTHEQAHDGTGYTEFPDFI